LEDEKTLTVTVTKANTGGNPDDNGALRITTADRRPPSWNRITDSTHAPSVGNGIGEPHCLKNVLYLTMNMGPLCSLGPWQLSSVPMR
jgi:hypothetical protein